MKPEDVREDMKVIITSGDDGHPLKGYIGLVVNYKPPLPGEPPASIKDPEFRALWHERGGVKELFEEPFAWPGGRVLVYLGPIEDGRPWPFPYVTVGPGDIEEA